MPYSDKAKKREYDKQWMKANPEAKLAYWRRWRFEKKYGITLERYEAIVVEQDNKCAVCLKPAASCFHGTLSIDHNHETGVVRGLLCQGCNIAIGVLEKALMPKLLAYLEKHK